MSAFVIVDIAVTDQDEYRRYIEAITPSVGRFGGRYRVRGGKPETLDGSWQSERVVVMEYPDRATAKAWLNDEELLPLHNMRRQNSSRCNMIVVDTLD